MNSSFDSISAASSAGERQTTFVPGIGEVPSGPRTSFSPFRVPARRAGTANTSSNTLVHIKREETERNWSSDSAFEEAEAPRETDIKREESPEPSGPSEFDIGYQNMFSRLLASSDRSSRSDTTGSRRQDTSEGRWSRSDRLTTSSRGSNTNRSRSPPQHSGSSGYTSSRGGSMFYPDSRVSRSPYPDTFIPHYSRLRGARRDSGAQHSQRPSLSQQSLPSEDSTSSPSLTTSISPSRSLSVVSQPQLTSSSTEPSPPPEEIEGEDTRCRCPIGVICPVRHTDNLDCRPLVREYKSWGERRDQEAWEQ